MEAARCHVADFTLAPKGGALLRDGTFAAATVQGITAAQQVPTGETGGKLRAALTLVPLAKDLPGAIVGAAPRRAGVFAWISVDKSGRLILKRSTAAGEDVVGSVAGAEHIYAFDHFVAVVTGDGDVHLFMLPPSVLDVTEDGDAVPRLEPLGVIATPGGDPELYIGMTVSTGAHDATAAVAIFAQHPDDTLHISAVALNGPAPAAEAWTAAVPMPSSALPVSWAVSCDASTVAIVPEAGHTPMLVQSSGVLPCDAIARSLAPANGNVVGTAAVSGTGFAFALRPKGAVTERVDLVLIPSATALQTIPAGGITGLTMKRATPVSLAARRSPANGSYHCRVLVGRTLYAPTLHVPSSKATAAAAAAAASGEAATTAAASPSVPVGALGLLAAMAVAGNSVDRAAPGAPAVKDVVDAAVSGKPFPTGAVMRDAGCTSPATSSSGVAPHEVIDSIIARAASGEAHEAVARYFSAARDVDASSVVHALLLLSAGLSSSTGSGADAAGASPKRGSPKRSGKPTKAPAVAPAPAECAVAAGFVMQASAEKIRGSFGQAWATSANDALRAAAAPLVFTALHAVLVHALSGGRLGILEAAMKAMDAIVAADVDALVAGCATTLRDAQSLLETVGTWASSEPGFRLGQLTAHSGPDFGLTKEPQVAPLRGHRIETSATIRVDHERQAL